MSIDFARVAQAALASAERLCSEWLGGKRAGAEWVGERTANGGPGDSWTVNMGTGKWMHGASDARGGDLISLYAALHGLSQAEAARAVADMVGMANGAAGPAVASVRQRTESRADPVPADAGDAPDHAAHGKPEAVYRYFDAAGAHLFTIARYRTATGKSFAQWTWRNNRWSPKSYPAPRPLYGLPELAKAPTLPVMVVEGERCADAARAVLAGSYCVVCWAGGAQAVKTADWKPLAGRDVVLWPDADEPGVKAMAAVAEAILGTAARVRVIKPAGQPEGWDIADAIADGWDLTRVIEWARPRVQLVERPALPAPSDEKSAAAPIDKPPPLRRGRRHDGVAPIEHNPTSAVASWESMDLIRNSGGVPLDNFANACKVLRLHPDMAGKIYYDSFREKIYTSRDGRPREWRDADDRDVALWMQEHVRLVKMQPKTVQMAVLQVAFHDQRNSFQDYVRGIKWDGTERLMDWVVDCLGAQGTDHHRAAGMNWFISMVARGFDPGCKADHMIVLEGKSGRGKSQTLEILGGLGDPAGNDWFAAVSTEFGSPKFIEQIQGKILVEIPDMSGFEKGLFMKIIGDLAKRVDPYRVPWDKYSSDHPRRGVFAGTSENSNYLAVPDGRRRYWPIVCGEINADLVREYRDQLFAEALVEYTNGAKWHEMPESTKQEQLDRVDDDPWTERVQNYLVPTVKYSSSELLTACEVRIENQSDGLKRRITKIMTKLGWEQKVDKIDGVSVKRWRKTG